MEDDRYENLMSFLQSKGPSAPVPCPFCGTEEGFIIITPRPGNFSVVCPGCNCNGPVCSTPMKAKLAWNNRMSVARKSFVLSLN